MRRLSYFAQAASVPLANLPSLRPLRMPLRKAERSPLQRSDTAGLSSRPEGAPSPPATSLLPPPPAATAAPDVIAPPSADAAPLQKLAPEPPSMPELRGSREALEPRPIAERRPFTPPAEDVRPRRSEPAHEREGQVKHIHEIEVVDVAAPERIVVKTAEIAKPATYVPPVPLRRGRAQEAPLPVAIGRPVEITRTPESESKLSAPQVPKVDNKPSTTIEIGEVHVRLTPPAPPQRAPASRFSSAPSLSQAFGRAFGIPQG